MRTARTIIFFLCLAILAAAKGYAQISSDDALSKFVAAGMAYKEGQYAATVERYKEILDGGRESGALYYNLGNSYYKKGDLGRAVLSYERAKRFIPRDGDLKFNADYVTSKIEGYGDDQNPNYFDRALKKLQHFFTVSEMAIIIVGIGFAVGLFILIVCFMPWPRQYSRWAIGLLLLVIVVFANGLVSKLDEERHGAVVVVKAASYFEPREDSTVHFELSQGTKVKILKTEGGWVKIQRPDGKIGWAAQETVEKIKFQ